MSISINIIKFSTIGKKRKREFQVRFLSFKSFLVFLKAISLPVSGRREDVETRWIFRQDRVFRARRSGRGIWARNPDGLENLLHSVRKSVGRAVHVRMPLSLNGNSGPMIGIGQEQDDFLGKTFR